MKKLKKSMVSSGHLSLLTAYFSLIPGYSVLGIGYLLERSGLVRLRRKSRYRGK